MLQVLDNISLKSLLQKETWVMQKYVSLKKWTQSGPKQSKKEKKDNLCLHKNIPQERYVSKRA